MRVIIQGVENVVGGLRAMANEIPRAASRTILDQAAEDARVRMSQEAPKGLSGNLASNITVTPVGQFTRVIEPTARNIQPGNKYALPIETGWGTVGAFPNVQSIANYYGVNLKFAFAIAAGIARKTYRANPFVRRTFNWVKGMIRRQVPPFFSQITAQYAKGGYK